MSVAPYIVLFSLAAVAAVEAIVYLMLKGEMPASRRPLPE